MSALNDSDVLDATLSWAAAHDPKGLAAYRSADDRRAAARRLLAARIAADGSVLYELSDGLLRKLGYTVDRTFDAAELELARVVRGVCWRRIGGRGE